MAPLKDIALDITCGLLDTSAQLAHVYKIATPRNAALAVYVTRSMLRARNKTDEGWNTDCILPPHRCDANDPVLGLAALMWTSSARGNGDTLDASILGLGVDAEHRRTGIGQALAEALVSAAFEVAQCAYRSRHNDDDHTTTLHRHGLLPDLSPAAAQRWTHLKVELHPNGSCRRKPEGLRILIRAGFAVLDTTRDNATVSEADLRLPKYAHESVWQTLQVAHRTWPLSEAWLDVSAPRRDGDWFLPAHDPMPAVGGSIASRLT